MAVQEAFDFVKETPASALPERTMLLPPFPAAAVERDGFGARAAFRCLLAELDGQAVGYAMYHDCYNSDLARRGLWLVDLYVEERARSNGLGRRLMAALARQALARGAPTLWWGGASKNGGAPLPYAAPGARGGRPPPRPGRGAGAPPTTRGANPAAPTTPVTASDSHRSCGRGCEGFCAPSICRTS